MSFLAINPYQYPSYTEVSRSGLTSYWRMDNNSNDDISSLNGADNNIQYVLSPTKFNYALSTSGSNQYTVMGNSQLIQTAVTWSLSFWMYPKTVNAYQSVIDNLGYDDLGPYRVMVNNANSTLLCTIGSSNVVFAANKLTVNTWHHIVLTRTSTTSATLYVNGVSSNFGSNTLRPSVNSKFVVSSRWRNGAGTYPDQYFNGIVEDVAYFKRVLSAAEVTTIYTGATSFNKRLTYLSDVY